MEIHFTKTDFINMIKGIDPNGVWNRKDLPLLQNTLEDMSLSELKKMYVSIKEVQCILYHNDCVKNIKRKYGVGKIVKIDEDNYPTTITCSEGSGRFTKVRVINNELEIYHDWFNSGWLTLQQALKEYPNATYEIINMF
jgi:hypothetical protein